MTKLTKMYALIATRYDDNNNPSMYILRDSLTEEDLIEYQNCYYEYIRLNSIYIEKVKENTNNKIVLQDLRTDFWKIAESRNNGKFPMRHYYDIWEEKQLIIEHYYI